jgi:hypothetical protein
MEELKARREKCLVDAADCELIANLATEPSKREIFGRLARQLKQMADDIGAVIAAREAKDAARGASVSGQAAVHRKAGIR